MHEPGLVSRSEWAENWIVVRIHGGAFSGVLLDRRYVATLNDRAGFWQKLHAAA